MDVLLEMLAKYESYEVSEESVVVYAEQCLIDDQGACKWEEINMLITHGYPVFPGERDSFGWLTGCIQTKRGILVFG
jgi:hypothetical protein